LLNLLYICDNMNLKGAESLPILFLGASQKGGKAMNFNISIDWKFITALGVAIGIDIFAIKMNTETATEVLINAIGTCKEFLVTEKCAN